MNIKVLLFGLLVIFLAIMLFIFVFPEHDEAGQNPIQIGATMSETGSYSTQGIAARNGYRLCEKHTNEQGGVLGREIEFVIYDDESDSDTAISLYEQLITEDNVDLVMGPYGSTLTEAVAPVTEQHQYVMISPLAATTSIWEQGREYLFMVLPPAELFLAGLIDMAAERDLETFAIIMEDELFPRAAGTGAAELAEEEGMEVVLNEVYESGTEDFSPLLTEIRENEVEVIGMAASALDDFITVTRQMKEHEVNVQMFGTSGVVDQYRDELGDDADYTYGLSAWEPVLPNPGNDEFVAAYEQEFDMAPSFHAAGGYGSCQIFMEAITEAGSVDSDEIRQVLLELETTTVFGDYAVDERGYQIANQGTFVQWQDGERIVVWPEDVATGEPRFPTPRWDER